MRKKLLLLSLVLFFTLVFEQRANSQISVNVTGTAVTTPALAASYTSLGAALTDLNSITAYTSPGTIILTCTAGGSETAPPTGLVIGSPTLNPLLSATNTVTINTSGGTVTLNAGIGTATPASAAPDGIISLRGADNITIDGLTLVDGNISNPTTMEFGIGIFKASLSDGASYNTIKNCIITVKNINNESGGVVEGSVGIRIVNNTATAATTNLVPTALAGTNSNNKIYSNIINGGNYGICLIGYAGASPPTACDVNNDIGGNSISTGNTITNFGGGGSANASAGIRTLAQYTFNVSYNTVNNNTGSNTNHANTLRGIFINTAKAATGNIDFNTVTVRSGATTATCTAIDDQAGGFGVSGTLLSISNNTISGSYTTATTGVWTGILANLNPYNCLVNNNTISGVDLAGTGTHQMIYVSGPANAFLAGNTITNCTNSGLSGTWNIVSIGSPTNAYVNSNTIDGLSWTNLASTGSTKVIAHAYSGTIMQFNTNIIRNISIPGTGSITGFSDALDGGGTLTIQDNQIYNFFTTAGGSGGGTFTGISWINPTTGNCSGNQIYSLNSQDVSVSLAGAVTGITYSGGTTIKIFKNRIYDLSSDSPYPSVSGIVCTGGTTTTMYNNLIGDLRATNANLANTLTGIRISGGTTVNLYYNTIVLNSSNTGALFSSSGIYAAITPALTMRNNVVVNTSAFNGAGNTAAYRRVSGTAGTPPSTYNAASNNNFFYAGTPGPSNLIYVEGTASYTNPQQTIAGYKSFMATNEQQSVSENPTWQSTTGSSPDFLKYSTTVATQMESGASNISTFTDDYTGTIRQGNSGYAGTGNAPDIGAWELNGIIYDLSSPIISGITAVGQTCNLVSQGVTAVINDQSGVDNAGFKPRIYYRKASGSYYSTEGSLTTGTVTSGTWTFNIDYSLLGGAIVSDVISYFIVAQDVPGNAGGSPPAGLVLTNVNSVTTPPTTPLTYTIAATLSGPYNVGAGQTYLTITAAIASYNASCLSGPVTFLLTDLSYSEAGAMTISSNLGASSTNTLTIKPTLAETTIQASATTAVFILNGVDYVTIDGSVGNTLNTCGATPASRDLTITNTSTGTSSAVIWLQSVGTTNGATNNTIKNCNLSGNSNTTTLFCLGSGTSGISTTSKANGSNNNAFINNNIKKSQHGIYTSGTSAVNKNNGTVISMNTITTAAPNNIAKNGIWAYFENGITISCNQVGGITYAGSADICGINCGFSLLTNSAPGGFEVTNATITNNFISGVVQTGTANSACGIAVASATSGTTLIANNVIYGVASNCNGNARLGAGILLGGSTGSLTKIYYNSVSMQGTLTGASATGMNSMCLGVNNSTAPVLDMRNNIFSNTQQGNTGATTTFLAVGFNFNSFSTLTCDNNVLYSAGSGPGTYVTGMTNGLTFGTTYTTLANWQAATSQDANSISNNPLFTSSSDLHTAVPDINNAGITLASVNTDIAGLTRTNPPDIGAWEFTLPITSINTLASSSVLQNTATINGNINTNNEVVTISFDYGLNTGYGSTTTGTPSPVRSLLQTSVSVGLTGLSCNTLYHYRIKGTSNTSAEVIAGGDQTFVTLPCPAITGSASLCAGTSGNVYTTESGNSGYAWLISAGGTITSGGSATDNTITITWNTDGPQIVSVNYNNMLGNPAPSPTVYNVTVNPRTAPIITGPNVLCTISTGNVYTTEAGMTGYVWSVSAGGTITSGGTSTSNTVTVTWNTDGAQTVSVNYTNSFGCQAVAATVYNVMINTRPTPMITGPTLLCAGTAGNVYATEAGMTGYLWTVSAGGTITAGGTGTSNTVTVTWNTGGPQTVGLNYSNSSGCQAVIPSVYNVMVNARPVPVVIGPTDVYLGSSGNIYSTAAEMTGYTWAVSVGNTINTGAGTNNVSVTWNTSGAQWISQNFTDPNGCTAESATIYNVQVSALPIPAGPITGASTVCQNQSGVVYSVAPVLNATSYIWSLPAGATISAGSNTNSITVNFSSTAVSGIITVCGANSLGNGVASPNYAVNVNSYTPPTLVGPVTVCNNATGNVYTTQAGMSSYVWSVSAGGTITAGGTGTSNTVNVTWNTDGAKTVSVNFANANGCTADAPTVYNVTVNPLPEPAITGPASVCVNSAGNIYITQAGMTGYTWIVPAGGTITAGAGTNAITVSWNTAGAQSVCVNYMNANGCVASASTCYNVMVNVQPTPTLTGPSTTCTATTTNVYTTESGMTDYIWAVSAGGTITVGGTATSNTTTVTWNTAGAQTISVNYNTASGCAASAATVYNIIVNPLPLPVITGPAAVCENSAGNIYTTQTGMTNYTWTISAGGTITAGAATNSISVTWSTAGARIVTVSYNNGNGCVPAVPAVFNVTVLSLPVPTITGPSATCAGTTGNVYTTESGMTGYTWTVSAGGTITAGGTPTSNTVTITWNTDGARTVSVNYSNAGGCSAIIPVVYPVIVNTTPIPTISGANTACEYSAYLDYTTQSGMTNYVWDITPNSGTITQSGTNVATIFWTSPGAKWVSVSYTNANGCAAAAPTVYNVSVNPLPVSPGAITGTAIVCAGASAVAYSVASVSGATGYTWTLPAGATIASGSGTNSITVDFGAAAVSGNISVTAQNACGYGPASPAYAVTVNQMPEAAGTITGTSNVCQGSSGIAYSVPNINGATSYNWSLPAGATIIAGANTNSITVNFGPTAVSGNISVNGVNTCGSGTASVKSVTVNGTPVTPVITLNANILTSSEATGNQWYRDGLAIAGATAQTYTVVVDGTYTAIVSLNNCSSEVSNSVIVIHTSVSEANAEVVNVYPNPNKGAFWLSITTKGATLYDIQVVNSIGAIVQQYNNIEVSGTFIQYFDLKGLTLGVYNIILRSDKNIIIRKIVIN